MRDAEEKTWFQLEDHNLFLTETSSKPHLAEIGLRRIAGGEVAPWPFAGHGIAPSQHDGVAPSLRSQRSLLRAKSGASHAARARQTADALTKAFPAAGGPSPTCMVR